MCLGRQFLVGARSAAVRRLKIGNIPYPESPAERAPTVSTDRRLNPAGRLGAKILLMGDDRFGATSEGGKGSDVLLEATVVHVPVADCKALYEDANLPLDEDSMVCAGLTGSDR